MFYSHIRDSNLTHFKRLTGASSVPQAHIAATYGVSAGTVSRTVRRCENVLRLRRLIALTDSIEGKPTPVDGSGPMVKFNGDERSEERAQFGAVCNAC